MRKDAQRKIGDKWGFTVTKKQWWFNGSALDIIEEAMADVENGLVPDSVLEEIKGW